VCVCVLEGEFRFIIMGNQASSDSGGAAAGGGGDNRNAAAAAAAAASGSTGGGVSSGAIVRSLLNLRNSTGALGLSKLELDERCKPSG
jgi:hypothetical protein